MQRFCEKTHVYWYSPYIHCKERGIIIIIVQQMEITTLSYYSIPVGFIHIVHLRAPAHIVTVRFGVTLECQPVTQLSFLFFPLTGGKGTPWKQDIVGVYFFEDLFNGDIVLVCLWQSRDYRGGGDYVWADCELLLPFKCASPFHYQGNLQLP